MCDGRWLMRDRRLLTLDEDRAPRRGPRRRRGGSIRSSSQREQSVLQKLIAIGGAAEQESFEIQVKARLADDTTVLRALESAGRHRDPPRPLPPVRHVLLLRRPAAGAPALPRRRVPRRAAAGRQRPRAADADRPDARGRVRLGAALPLALLRARHPHAAVLPRVLQAGARGVGREGSPSLAGGVPRGPVLRPPRPAAQSARGTAASSR